jgi:hypothetical protein
LEPPRTAEVEPARAVCRGQVARAETGTVRLESVPTTLEAQLDALWAITQLVWDDPALDCSAALASLELVG